MEEGKKKDFCKQSLLCLIRSPQEGVKESKQLGNTPSCLCTILAAAGAGTLHSMSIPHCVPLVIPYSNECNCKR